MAKDDVIQVTEDNFNFEIRKIWDFDFSQMERHFLDYAKKNNWIKEPDKTELEQAKDKWESKKISHITTPWSPENIMNYANKYISKLENAITELQEKLNNE